MEIGSAYALQVCLIQIPAMLAFTAFYGIGKESMAHHAFTCVTFLSFVSEGGGGFGEERRAARRR